jgi:hypothetical protein
MIPTGTQSITVYNISPYESKFGDWIERQEEYYFKI